MKGLLALMIIYTILYQLTHWSNALIHCIFIQFYLFSWANKKQTTAALRLSHRIIIKFQIKHVQMYRQHMHNAKMVKRTNAI